MRPEDSWFTEIGMRFARHHQEIRTAEAIFRDNRHRFLESAQDYLRDRLESRGIESTKSSPKPEDKREREEASLTVKAGAGRSASVLVVMGEQGAGDRHLVFKTGAAFVISKEQLPAIENVRSALAGVQDPLKVECFYEDQRLQVRFAVLDVAAGSFTWDSVRAELDALPDLFLRSAECLDCLMSRSAGPATSAS